VLDRVQDRQKRPLERFKLIRDLTHVTRDIALSDMDVHRQSSQDLLTIDTCASDWLPPETGPDDTANSLVSYNLLKEARSDQWACPFALE
jgi:hypothetical protein